MNEGSTVEAILRDGTSIALRAVGEDDRAAARAVRPGEPGCDTASVLLRVSALVELVPELVELDLNPVVVHARGDGAVAVDARMRLAAHAASTYP